MKVLQINSVCGVGSTGRIATDLDKLLKAQGYDSYIAYGRGDASGCYTTIKIGKPMDTYAHVLVTRLFDRHGFASASATRKFIADIQSLAPDIIHLHNIHGYYVHIGLLFDYIKSADIPVVWTLHDCWAFTGHCAYFDTLNCAKWKTGCGQCPGKHNYPSSVLFDNSTFNYHKKADLFSHVKRMHIVTPSNWLRMLADQSFLKDYPKSVINNGIDLKVFQPRGGNFKKIHNIENSFMILGIAGVWDARKGLTYLLRLSEKMGSDSVIVLVGLTEEQNKKLPKNIIGITHTDSVEELVEIYSSADVYVNPTLEDNFPTTNLEALACGVPVITFDTGGSAESVDPSCGYVVKREDFEGLFSAIESIKSNTKAYYTAKCVKRAKEYYDKQDRFNDYIDLYKDILSMKNVRRDD